MKLMGIDNFDVYCETINSILNHLDAFFESIEFESVLSSKKGKKNPEVESIIEKIQKITTSYEDKNKVTEKKAIANLYQHSVSFLPTDKIESDFPMS